MNQKLVIFAIATIVIFALAIVVVGLLAVFLFAEREEKTSELLPQTNRLRHYCLN